jgi:hypothetical protein
MPAENVGLANSLMEALASADPGENKPRPLLRWVEERLARMLEGIVRVRAPGDDQLLTNFFMMAYDGFVINRRLNDLRDIEQLVEIMCDMLLGSRQRAALRRGSRPTRLRKKELVTKSQYSRAGR